MPSFINSKIKPSESPERVNSLQQIQQWLNDNPNVNACRDMNHLMFFLRSCKYDLEKTKKKIKRWCELRVYRSKESPTLSGIVNDSYSIPLENDLSPKSANIEHSESETSFYLMRAERTEWFANRDPFLPEIQELLSLGVFLPLQEKDEHNRQVVIIRTAAHNPRTHTQNNVFKVSKMILDLLLKFEPEISSDGIVAIFDMNGVQLGHALQLNPKLIKRSVDSWQVYPCKPKLLEFVNTPTHVNLILNTFRLFMTSKMRSRVIVRKQSSEVKINLPKDLGGTNMPYQELAMKWKCIVEKHADYFAEHEKYKSIVH